MKIEELSNRESLPGFPTWGELRGASLRVSMVQSDIIVDSIDDNINYFGNLLRSLTGKTDLAILPELFTTGMINNLEGRGESNDGKTITVIKKYANEYGFAVTGSFLAQDNDKYYNRAFFITPDGQEYYYDKRHLFRMAGENYCFSAGSKRLIVDYLGWKICLMVCYDLRFPVWSRNVENEYDLLIYVANWPEARKMPWKALLKARAIENLCYVCGVNRVGIDSNDIKYHGDSRIYSPKGEKLIKANDYEEIILTETLDIKGLQSFRAKFPAWIDADMFELKL